MQHISNTKWIQIKTIAQNIRTSKFLNELFISVCGNVKSIYPTKIEPPANLFKKIANSKSLN